MSELPKFYENRDLGDEDPTGGEIMYRLMQAELKRVAELQQAEGVSENDTPITNSPSERATT